MFKSRGLHFPKIPIYGQHPLKAHILFFGALLASFRPSSDINCEWMQTPAEEYGLQEACHILSPLGRTFNLLSWGTAPFQVVQLKDMHLPAFYSLTARRFKRRESIWSKRYYTDCRCGIFSTNFNTSTATGKATKKDVVWIWGLEWRRQLIFLGAPRLVVSVSVFKVWFSCLLQRKLNRRIIFLA